MALETLFGVAEITPHINALSRESTTGSPPRDTNFNALSLSALYASGLHSNGIVPRGKATRPSSIVCRRPQHDHERPQTSCCYHRCGFWWRFPQRKALARADVDITLIDRHNYHLFQPLLYQVATAALSPADIASPIRSVLRLQKKCPRVVLANVSGIDIVRSEVHARDTGFS